MDTMRRLGSAFVQIATTYSLPEGGPRSEKLVYACLNCNYRVDAEDFCVHRHSIRHTAAETSQLVIRTIRTSEPVSNTRVCRGRPTKFVMRRLGSAFVHSTDVRVPELQLQGVIHNPPHGSRNDNGFEPTDPFEDERFFTPLSHHSQRRRRRNMRIGKIEIDIVFIQIER